MTRFSNFSDLKINRNFGNMISQLQRKRKMKCKRYISPSSFPAAIEQMNVYQSVSSSVVIVGSVVTLASVVIGGRGEFTYPPHQVSCLVGGGVYLATSFSVVICGWGKFIQLSRLVS